ncbi:MAG: M23 family metallopeptidase [Desulfobacteraceae bacterium]|nr:M23 family metallopeptidase [Desulfobacteraceae bacterium]
MNKIIYRQILAVLCFFVFVLPAQALNLDGNFVQGGLIIGKADQATSVFFQGKSLRVSARGIFIIGFDRDAPLQAVLKLKYANGKLKHHKITITKRTYNTQQINGLPPEKVEPKSANILKRIRKEAAIVKKARQLDAPRTDFNQGFIWPVIGEITGVYGSQRVLNGKPRRPHYGIDISAPTGMPVKSPADGVVTLVHPDMFFSGGTLIIDHGHGLSSCFLHLHKHLVKQGQKVKQGQVVAQVGATGRVTGAHLDWRMNWFDKRIDPALLVPPMPNSKSQIPNPK